MISIAVLPYMYWQHKETGQRITKFSTFPDGNPNNWERVTQGFTWGVTDYRGTYTEGLGRRPVETAEEANAIARELAGPNTELSLWIEV